MAGGLDPAHISEVLTMRQKRVGGVDAECIAEHSGFTKLVLELISHDVSVVAYNLNGSVPTIFSMPSSTL